MGVFGSSRQRNSILVLCFLILAMFTAAHPARGLTHVNWAFSYSPSQPIENNPITFTTSCYGTPPCYYNWVFGDGTSYTCTGCAPTVTHTYAAGTYTVTLNGQDSQDTYGSSSQTINVYTCGGLGLNFYFSPTTPIMEQSVTFTGNRPSSCGMSWNFGDGSVASGQVVTHAFASGGTFTVKIGSTDDNGNPVTVTHPVTVGYSDCSAATLICLHRPGQANYQYRANDPNGPVTAYNSASFPSSSPVGAVGLGLSVEVLNYTKNIDSQHHDEYTIAILGTATSRLAHQYSGPSYANNWDLNQCPGDFNCQDLGITQLNGGYWLNLNAPMYYYGHAYQWVFVCSNGYAAFVYDQSKTTCPSSTQAFPTKAIDSSGNVLAIPDAVIAPLWKPLNASYPGAHIYYQENLPKYRGSNPPVWSFGITWYGLQTQGESNPNLSCAPCTNTFSMSFDSIGNIYFSYPANAVSSSDTAYTPTVGVEDASGTLSTVSNPNTAVSSGGVTMNDPFYVGSPPNSQNRPDNNYAYLQGIELTFHDITAGDGASLAPTIFPTDIYGSNLELSGPSITYLKNDPASEFAAQLAEQVALDAICLPLAEVWCLALNLADISAHHYYDQYQQWNSQANPVSAQSQQMLDSKDGYIQLPVEQQDGLCGYGYFPSSSTPFQSCSSDASIFDVVQYVVAGNTAAVHKLSISVGEVEGTSYCCVNFGWATVKQGASVTLKIDPGDFSAFASTPSPVAILPGGSSTASINLGSVNDYQAPVYLSVSQPNGIVASLSPTSVPLLAGGSGSSTLTIQTSTSTNPGQYSVMVVARDTSGGVNHSFAVPFNVTDFSISGTPNPLGGPATASASWTITATELYGFTGTITLSDVVSSGLTCLALSPSSLTLTGTVQVATSTLSCSGASAGTYLVQVTGNSAPLTHAVTLTFNAQDFTMSANPTSINSTPSSPGTSTVILTSLDTFSGPVNLSVNTPSGFTVTLGSTSLSLSSGGTASTTLTVSVTGTPNAGTYTITVTGASVPLTHTMNVYVTYPGDYAISAPATTNVNNGSTGSSTVTVGSSNGFTGTVNLSLTVSPSTGLSCWFSVSSVSLSPTTATGTSTLSCSGSTGIYLVTVTGASGSYSHSTTDTFNVQDFSVTASQNSRNSVVGPMVSSNVTFTGINGFTGTVVASFSVSPSSGLSCTLFPTSVNLSLTTTSAISVLSCSGTPGNYTVTVVSMSGSLSHSITLPFVSFQESMTFAGVTATVNTIFTAPSPLNNVLYGATSLTEKNSTSGASIMSSTVAMSVSSSDNIAAYFIAETPNAPYWLSVECTLKINTVSSCSFQRTLDVAYQGSGTINIVDVATTANSYGSTLGSPKYYPPADLSASGTVSFEDVATEAYWYGRQVFLMTPSIMSLSSGATNLVFPNGSSVSTTITTTSQNSWTGTTLLAIIAAPLGPSCSIVPASGTLPAGGTITATLACSSSTSGTFSVSVYGANANGLGEFVLVHLNVTDFGVKSSQGSFSFNAGSAGSSGLSLTLASLYAFSGTVTLSTSAPPGISVSCPTGISLATAGTASAGCTVSTLTSLAGGTYTASITASSSTISHTVSITIYVQDFAISESPNNISIPKGTSVPVTISVQSLGLFSGNVTLTVTSVSPSNVCATWSAPYTNCNTGSAKISLTAGGTATATLNLGTYTNGKGTHTITVTATSGSYTHTVTFTVNVV